MTVKRVTRLETRPKSESSRRWLLRQLNDPYVQKAKQDGYRSRAAYKVLEMDQKFSIFKKNNIVIDLGSAPGGWTQVAAARVGEEGYVIGVDLLDMPPIRGTHFMQGDFLSPYVRSRLEKLIPQKAHVVLSDMAPSFSGMERVDALRIDDLLDNAFEFCCSFLRINGRFVAKTLRSGTSQQLLTRLKPMFQRIVHFKPISSRQESSEMYVVALGFRGMPNKR